MAKTAQQTDPLGGIATLIERFTELQRQCNQYAQRRVNLQEEAKAVNGRRPGLDRRKAELLEQQQEALSTGDEAALKGTMEQLRVIESEHGANRSRLSELDIEQSRIAAEARNVLMPDFEVLSAESKQIESRIAAMLRDLVHERRRTLDLMTTATKPA